MQERNICALICIQEVGENAGTKCHKPVSCYTANSGGTYHRYTYCFCAKAREINSGLEYEEPELLDLQVDAAGLIARVMYNDHVMATPGTSSWTFDKSNLAVGEYTDHHEPDINCLHIDIEDSGDPNPAGIAGIQVDGKFRRMNCCG